MAVRNPLLHFYWVEFTSSLSGQGNIGWLHEVCGVTAFTPDDALYLIREQVSEGRTLPPIRVFIEDVNLATLDRGHIVPHISLPIFRGVWYPPVDRQGYRRGRYPRHRHDDASH